MWSWPSYMGLQSLHPSCWEPHGGHSKLVWYLSKPRLHNINPILSINQYKEENPDSDVMRWDELSWAYLHGCEVRRRERVRQRREREGRGRGRATWLLKKAKWRACLFQRQWLFWVLVCWSVKNPFQSPSLLCYFVAANNGEREREREDTRCQWRSVSAEIERDTVGFVTTTRSTSASLSYLFNQIDLKNKAYPYGFCFSISSPSMIRIHRFSTLPSYQFWFFSPFPSLFLFLFQLSCCTILFCPFQIQSWFKFLKILKRGLGICCPIGLLHFASVFH